MKKDLLLPILKEIRNEIHSLSEALAVDRDMIKDLAQDISDVRSRLIEEQNRIGSDIHRHQKAILEHEARLYAIEQRAKNNGA